MYTSTLKLERTPEIRSYREISTRASEIGRCQNIVMIRDGQIRSRSPSPLHCLTYLDSRPTALA